MKIAYFIKKNALFADQRVEALLSALVSAGEQVYDVSDGLQEGTGLLLSFGGDGTFLSAASLACCRGIPVLGVNLGRLGFLSDNEIEGLAESISGGSLRMEERTMLEVSVEGNVPEGFAPYALNEMVIRRLGSGTLALDVKVDGESLPTYWADGLIVSTSSGSTAYSLSVGGPILYPDVHAFILEPIAPHNLNLRPLVLPQSAKIEITACDRKTSSLALSLDNRDYIVRNGTCLHVCKAPVTLKKMTAGNSNFIGALQSKLFWGEDVRNTR